MLKLGSSLVRGGASLLTFVKDNLKLYLDFTSNKSDTLKFPSEGSTEFSGSSQYIDCGTGIGTSLGDNYAGSLTVSLWFKADVTNSNDGLFNIGSFSSTQGEFAITIESNILRFKLNAVSWNINHTSFTSTDWNHVACVYSAGNESNSKMYLNGVSVGSASGTFPSASDMDFSGLKTIIGAYYSSGYPFDGKIANVGLWSRELSPEEIQSIMNKSYSQLKGVEKTSLVAWWSLDSASNGVVQPSTGEVLGAERVLNSDFSDGGNLWTLNNANVVNEVLEIDEGAFSYYAQQSVDGGGSAYRQFESGYLMKLEIVVDEYTSGGTIIYATGNNIGTFDSAGTHTIYYKPSANEYFRLRSGGSGFEGKISSVSIKRVTNDIVAYYPLDGDSSIPALSFDGTDDTIQTSAHDTLVDTTYTFWAKSDVTGANGGLFGHGGVTKSSFHFNYFGATGGARFYLGGSYFKKWDIDEQDDGQWHHYAIVADADSLANLKLYVDGVEQTVALSDSSGSPDAFTQSLTIGSDATNGNEWEGSIAQFAVYSDLKDADFIKAQYDKAIDADLSSDSGLVGYWKMNNGTTVNDLSGNGNNGTVSGATLIQNAVALDSTDNNNDGSLN